MELHILSVSQALAFHPETSTYAIRIHNSQFMRRLRGPLQDSQLYRTISEYIFDDIERRNYGKVLFDEKMARKILSEFRETGTVCEALLVHCTRGRNRSPAVAMALNNVFKLGNEMDMLEMKFSDTNWYVYNIIMRVAKQDKYF